MIKFYKPSVYRKIAFLFLFCITTNIAAPLISYGLTSGPSQPEFSSFESVSTTQMVNEFTGDFTYNIPLINVPGPHGSSYPLSMSYHSGASPEEDASWVGYGWTLNPGAINRNTRGLPDDYKGEITYHNKTPRNWTVTGGASIASEAFSSDKISINATASLRYNNYAGFALNKGIGLNLGKGLVSLNYNNSSDGNGSFSASLSPISALNQQKEAGQTQSNTAHNRETNRGNETSKNFKPASQIPGKVSALGGSNGLFSYSEIVRPTHVTGYTGSSINVSVGLQGNPGLPIGSTINIFGSYSDQTNIPKDELQAYGYMYAEEAKGKNKVIQDYYIEKDKPYSKREYFLGVPFNNADNFVVSGEGVGGGFRLYHKELINFYPNYKENVTTIMNLGAEVNVGSPFGPGFDVGVGKQTLEDGNWDYPATPVNADKKLQERAFFRFNNDLGGDWQLISKTNNKPVDDKPIKAILHRRPPHTPGKKFLYPVLPNLEQPKVATRGAFIGYNINSRLQGGRAYSKRNAIEHLTSRNIAPDAIGEMAVFDQNGSQYVYGLPVYSRLEKTMQYGVQGTSEGNIKSKFIVYSNNNSTQIGEERKKPYANTFLLTEITTPDFIDVNQNGPDEEDFGGYTCFNYLKRYGSGNKSKDLSWYKWRTPYKGLSYQRNSLSDSRDDVGTVSEGEKEIVYLQSIRTKTHTAIFYTSDRFDGLDAASDARTNEFAQGNKVLKKLDKIELYFNADVKLSLSGSEEQNYEPLDGTKKPIKTVHFEYKNELCPAVANAKNPGDNNAEPGKLTLTKVWFDYNNITKISPYIFEYNYPKDYNIYPDKYQVFKDGYEKYHKTYLADKAASPINTTIYPYENPKYDPLDIDAWGNYQYNGETRHDKLQSWVNQKPEERFDPAAWQLKVIKLPSGGEIHVQYEQDDYSFVQDKLTHALVNLTSDNSSGTGDTFILNTASLGLNKKEVIDYIKNIYLNGPDGKKKIYFKFLYTLVGINEPTIDKCNSEYISGYVDIDYVVEDGENVRIKLARNNKYALPVDVCRDFYKTQRSGRIDDVGGNCDPAKVGISDTGKKPRELVTQLASLAIPNKIACLKLNPALSYFRIPFPGNKKGGGIRVKRLLTYTIGLNGERLLYGNEYNYNFFDKDLKRERSSGVATNEPGTMRDENPLIDYMPSKKQSTISKIVAGVDRSQAEGPLGESILPGPSVGYSRVTVKNIHSGKSNPGFSIKEFYTAKDFPVKVDYTKLDKTATESDYLNLPLGISNTTVNNFWATQGFSFILNSMHGQVKRTATYAGDYSDIVELKNAVLVTEQVNEYFKPGRYIPVMDQPGGRVDTVNLGKEIDFTIAQRAVKDHLIDGSLETDVNVYFLGIFVIPLPAFFFSATQNTAELYTHATSKVVRYPAILKKVTSVQNGIRHVTENLAFDKFSGQPVAVRSWDEHNGAYLKQDVMASWVYPGMRHKATHEGSIFSEANTLIGGNVQLITENGKKYLSFPGNDCLFLANFSKGDVLELTSKANPSDRFVFHIDEPEIVNKRLRLYALNTDNSGSSTIPITAVEILRSGHRNQLFALAGSNTYHSTSRNIFPNPLPQGSDRYENSDLANALTNALATGSIGGLVELPGSFSGVNVSSFRSLIPENCRSQVSNMTIHNVKVKRAVTDNKITLEIASFAIECNGLKVIKY